MLDVNPGERELHPDNTSVVKESSCPIEANDAVVTACAQKEPLRRQLIIGMSDTTDEFTL